MTCLAKSYLGSTAAQELMTSKLHQLLVSVIVALMSIIADKTSKRSKVVLASYLHSALLQVAAIVIIHSTKGVPG